MKRVLSKVFRSIINAERKRDNTTDKKAKWVTSIGNASNLKIPDSLPYAGALEKIKEELANTGVTIDIDSFYTETPVKLHNFVNEITYNFITTNDVRVIAYEIAVRAIDGTIYNEVDYDGNVIFSCSTYSLGREYPGYQEHIENMLRINEAIWKYGYYTEINT